MKKGAGMPVADHFPPVTDAHSATTVDRSRKLSVWLVSIIAGILCISLAGYEMQTSTLQAWLFSRLGPYFSYAVQAGPSGSTAYPQAGPFDVRYGYTALPSFQHRLEARGYRVEHQARLSPALIRLIKWGVAPPSREPVVTGLTLHGADGALLYTAAPPGPLFTRSTPIPPLLSNTLLFLENRELQDGYGARSNPAIEWDRLAKAALLYSANWIGFPVRVQGGSTLAIQLEKFRHSPRGRTETVTDKLRQLIGASLKAYHDGPATREWRQTILVDYLNTIPLAAAPGYGEIHGLGEGLRVWFGFQLEEVVTALAAPSLMPAKVQAFTHVLALLVSLPAPTHYLARDRHALKERVNVYSQLLSQAGVLNASLAQAIQTTPLVFQDTYPFASAASAISNKATTAIRTELMELLGLSRLYDLDRLHLEVQGTLDVPLQNEVSQVLHKLADPAFVTARGFNQRRLVEGADPRKLIYSFVLYERSPAGNLLRVQADNLPQALNMNTDVKLEFGSTAKLRTLAHYLELIASLYDEATTLEPAERLAWAQQARDPLTRWAAEILSSPDASLTLDIFLQKAMDRYYSASPYERFFTGGGSHVFHNFSRAENRRRMTLQEAFQHSTNLVFIRLMRELAQFHQARLLYDAEEVLSNPDSPTRQRFLEEIAEAEAMAHLRQTYKMYHGLTLEELVARLLGNRAHSLRHLSIVFFAWHPNPDADGLGAWLQRWQGQVSADEVSRMWRAYSNPSLTIKDYGYLLSRRPLTVWGVGQLFHDSNLSWQTFRDTSPDARRTVSAWLLQPRHRRAQNLRLRTRIERDAFARMTPAWQRLGFPFSQLVPSYATAIGNSSDTPAALAELMGIIVNDGMQRPMLQFTRFQFGQDTPYETVLTPAGVGEQVMKPGVARALRTALAGVVERGTARRINGTFVQPDGTFIVIGGKTGSGDNRFKTFYRGGGVRSSRAVNRTAAFMFYIGDRYFGVVTAFVPGEEAAHYRFTSALPVSILKLLAPTIKARLVQGPANRGLALSTAL